MRPRWGDLPESVQVRVSGRLGGPVTEVASMAGGFTPGLASILRAGAGERVFVKAGGPHPNPSVPPAYRREARIAAALPADLPAPHLLWWEEVDEWVVLAFEFVDGTPPRPEEPKELDQVLLAIEVVARLLTPSPIQVPLLIEDWAEDFTGWRRHLSEGSVPLPRFGVKDSGALSTLAALEATWTRAAAGHSLLHGDLRLDNMLVTNDGVVFVDWPNACLGAPWVDLIFMLPSLAMHGVDIDSILDGHPLLDAVDHMSVDAVLCALCGYFVASSLLPPPPGLASVREFQAQQGEAGMRTLARRRPDLGIHVP